MLAPGSEPVGASAGADKTSAVSSAEPSAVPSADPSADPSAERTSTGVTPTAERSRDRLLLVDRLLLERVHDVPDPSSLPTGHWETPGPVTPFTRGKVRSTSQQGWDTLSASESLVASDRR